MDYIVNPGQLIQIGRLGENQYIRVLFDISGYLSEIPGASFTLLNTLPGETTAYPVPSVTVDSQYLYWTIESRDVSVRGLGECELIVKQGDVIAKSVIYRTNIARALDGSGEIPEVWDSWQEVFAGLKEDAEQAARDASAAASDASGSADSAQASSQAVQNLDVSAETLAAGSAATVTKTVDPGTGAVALKFGIPRGATGAQGPQGQAGATPDISIGTVTTGPAGSSASAAMGGTAAQPVLNLTIPKGDPGEVTAAQLAEGLTAKADMIHSAASGPVACFSDGAAYPVDRLTVYMEPAQTGSGDPSPTNIRPITGRSGARVTRAGKNLCPKFSSGSANGIAWTVGEDGVITFSGTASALTQFSANCHIPAGSLTFGCFNNLTNSDLKMFLITDRGNEQVNMTSVKATKTVTISAYTSVVRIRIAAGMNVDSLVLKPMICFGPALPEYVPYAGSAAEVSWQAEDGTVCGGYADITGGTLTATWVKKKISDFTWSYSTYNSANAFRTDPLDILGNSPEQGVMCSAFASESMVANYAGSANKPNHTVYRLYTTQERRIFVKCTEYTGVSDFLAAYGNEEIAYKLAAPAVIPFTPAQVSTLYGINHIWSDAGDVSVGYKADTRLYIDGLTQPEADMTASANIASGKYFVVNHTLYISTSAISAGEAIVPGTNCTPTNLAEALNAINA